MKELYYEDVDDIALSMLDVMVEKFKQLDVTLSESQQDEIYDIMQNHLRDKYSCYCYKNYN
jgi:hypothetical protein